MKETLTQMAREVGKALSDVRLIGLGIDLADVAWAEGLLEKYPARLGKIFTEAELAYCRAKMKPAPYLAARMAAKEAVLKALGTGLVGGMAWREIEIVHDDATGRPDVQLHGEVRRAAEAAGVTRWVVSLTHRGEYAAAIAAAVGGSEQASDG